MENEAYILEALKMENQHRREILATRVSSETLSSFDEILENLDGDPQNIFDPHGRVMHTTNSYAFENILKAGSLQEGVNSDGIYRTPGVSFTDGDSEMALSFQTLFDDQNTRSTDKQLNSSVLLEKVDGFVGQFWATEQGRRELSSYLGALTKEKPPQSKEDAIRMAGKFKFQATPKQIADDPEALSKLYGITIVYRKESLPDLDQTGTEGIQSKFEKRSHRTGGVPLSEAEIVLVPKKDIAGITERLKQIGLSHIKVRATEELEARRMIEIAGSLE